MKKSMRKILCLVLVLMMAMPLITFPASAGDLLYTVDFRGDNVYEPVDGRNSWNYTEAEPSGDGTYVELGYTTASSKGKDQKRARFCSEIMEDFDVKGMSYTIEFTVDSEAYVGFMLDGTTGFIVNPKNNETSIGKAGDIEALGEVKTYAGTGDSEQTYAIELSVAGTTSTNVNDADAYFPIVYKLYVQLADGTWMLIRDMDDDESIAKYFEWEVYGSDEDYAFFYLSINRYNDDYTSKKTTVSDVKIYKGIDLIDDIVPEQPEPPVSYESLFSEVKLQGYTNAGNKFGFGTDTKGDAAIDGVLHDSKGYAGSAVYNDLTKNTFFDENGQIACKKGNGNYYGVIVAELKELTILDTFTVWTPNGLGSTWFDNVAYDIYYSIDGESFAPVNGASFDDVRSDAYYEAVNESDFLGKEATSGITSGEYAGKIYKNEIPMNGVTAKYVAIAVKETLPKDNSDQKQIVLYEITAIGTPVKMYLESGASVRMDNPTGLRFTGLVNKDYFDGLVEQYGAENVKMGMLITPNEYLNGIEFTKEALDAANINGVKYLEIDAETVLEDGSNYKVNCVIANIKEANYDRAFSAILYVKVTDGDTTTYTYSEYNEANNSRSVAEVAEAAYYDLKDEETDTHTNAVSVVVAGETVTKYSRYTQTQINTLYGFFG